MVHGLVGLHQGWREVGGAGDGNHIQAFHLQQLDPLKILQVTLDRAQAVVDGPRDRHGLFALQPVPDRLAFVAERRPDVLHETTRRDVNTLATQQLDVAANGPLIARQQHPQIFGSARRPARGPPR